jgi:hypothetical protein
MSLITRAEPLIVKLVARTCNSISSCSIYTFKYRSNVKSQSWRILHSLVVPHYRQFRNRFPLHTRAFFLDAPEPANGLDLNRSSSQGPVQPITQLDSAQSGLASTISGLELSRWERKNRVLGHGMTRTIPSGNS